MARGKKRSERVERKQQQTKKPTNVFDLQFSRRKHATLGGAGKAVRSGAPSVARRRENDKRKNTLMQEFRNLSRTGAFEDHRIGEADTGLSLNEKSSLRFIAERQRRAKKSSRFRLAEDEEETSLTHRGSAISEIDLTGRDFEPEPEIDLDDAGLQAEFVRSMHFGGGDDDEQFMSPNEIPLGSATSDRQTLISKLMVEAKERKVEDFAQREEVKNMTTKLDESWRNLLKQSVTGISINRSGNSSDVTPSHPDFDKMYVLLQQDKIIPPVEKEASTPSKAKLEREKKRKLRREAEGQPIPESTGELSTVQSKKRRADPFIVQYDSKGRLLNADALEPPVVPRTAAMQQLEPQLDDDSDDDSGSEPESELSDEQGDDIGPADDSSEMLPPLGAVSLPPDYAGFRDLLQSRSGHQTATLSALTGAVIKESNKQSRKKLFLYLLRFFCNDSASDDARNELGRQLHRLLKMNVPLGFEQIKAVLGKYKEMAKRTRSFPGRPLADILTLVASLFTSEDVLRFAFSTGASVLSNAPVKKFSAFSEGLQLSRALLNYESTLRTHYSNELAGFLLGSLWVMSPDLCTQLSPSPNFSNFNVAERTLIHGMTVESIESDAEGPLQLSPSAYGSALLDLFACVSRLANIWLDLPLCARIFAPFRRAVAALPTSNFKNEEILAAHASLLEKLNSLPLNAPIDPVKVKTAAVFKLLTPKFDVNYNPETDKKRGTGTGRKAEEKKFSRKVSREMRGAMRELRKDAQFLTRERQTAEANLDAERALKTKKIMNSLMGQESEYQQLKKKVQK